MWGGRCSRTKDTRTDHRREEVAKGKIDLEKRKGRKEGTRSEGKPSSGSDKTKKIEAAGEMKTYSS